MFQQIAFLVVVTLIGVATLAFADPHETAPTKPSRPASRPTESTGSRGPAILTPDQVEKDKKDEDETVVREFGEAVEQLMEFNMERRASDSMPGEGNPHGNPNLISMPQSGRF